METRDSLRSMRVHTHSTQPTWSRMQKILEIRGHKGIKRQKAVFEMGEKMNFVFWQRHRLGDETSTNSAFIRYIACHYKRFCIFRMRRHFDSNASQEFFATFFSGGETKTAPNSTCAAIDGWSRVGKICPRWISIISDCGRFEFVFSRWSFCALLRIVTKCANWHTCVHGNLWFIPVSLVRHRFAITFFCFATHSYDWNDMGHSHDIACADCLCRPISPLLRLAFFSYFSVHVLTKSKICQTTTVKYYTLFS